MRAEEVKVAQMKYEKEKEMIDEIVSRVEVQEMMQREEENKKKEELKQWAESAYKERQQSKIKQKQIVNYIKLNILN